MVRKSAWNLTSDLCLKTSSLFGRIVPLAQFKLGRLKISFNCSVFRSFLLLREKSSRGEVSLSKLVLKCWEALSRCVQQRDVPKNNDRRANSLSTILRTSLDAREVDMLRAPFATMMGYVAAVHYTTSYVFIGRIRILRPIIEAMIL